MRPMTQYLKLLGLLWLLWVPAVSSALQVSGTVTNSETGAVVTGATVRACVATGCANGILATLLTSGTGQYVWANPPAGSSVISVIAEGFSPRMLPAWVSTTDVVVDVPLLPFKGIDGVVMAGGAPLANATVNLTLAGSQTLEDSVTTDASGRYRLWNPPGGVHDLNVVPPGGSPYKAATVASFQYEPGTMLTRDVTLTTTGFVIAGKVTGEGAAHVDGMAGALVKVFNGNTLVGSSTTDANGAYSVSGMNGASYHLVVTPPAGTQYAVTVVRDVVAGSAARGNVTLDQFLLLGSSTVTVMLTNQRNGLPVAGATVELCPFVQCGNAETPPPVIATATSNAQGVATLSQMPFGTQGVRVSATGFLGASQLVSVSGLSQAVSFYLQENITLQGTVTGGGTALAGAAVKMYPAFGDTLLKSATTNASGQYSMTGLVPGIYDLVVTPVNGSAYFRKIVERVSVLQGTVTQNIVVDGVASGAARYSVKGKVSATGFPAVPGAEVRLYAQGSSGAVHPLAEATTDSSGNYSLAVAPYGTYELHVKAPSGSTLANVIVPSVVVNSAGTTRDISIVVGSAWLSGNIADSISGMALEGAVIDVCTAITDGKCVSRLDSVTTNAAGNYSLLLGAGNWALAIRREGYVGVNTSVTILGTNVVRNLMLDEANVISGVVLGDAEPMAGLLVIVKHMSTGSFVDSAVTGEDGRYVLDEVPNGLYAVVAYEPKDSTIFATTTVPDVSVFDEDITIDITMEHRPVEVSGEVSDENGDPAPDALVELCEAAMELCTDPIAQTTTDANGTYALPVGEGEYCLHITVPGRPKEKVCFFSGGDAPVDLDCTLALMHGINGKIFGNRAPIAGVTVQVFVPGELVPLFSVVSAADGSYAFPNLANGLYDLVVTPPQGTPYVRSLVPGVMVQAARTVQDIVLMVMNNSFATLQGRVVDEDGTPLAGVTIGAWHSVDVLFAIEEVRLDSDVTGPDGTYSLRVPTDMYSLSVSRHDFSLGDYVTGVNATGTVTQDVVIPMVNVSGTVTVAGSGAGAPNTRLDFEGGGVETSVMTNASGNYSLRLPAFAHAVRLVPAPGTTQGLKVVSFLPKLDQDSIRNFSMEAAVSLSGVARDLAGRTLPKTGVVVRDQATGLTMAQTTTDASGRYQISKLAPGLLNISVYGEGYSLPGRFPSVELSSAGLAYDLTIPLIYVAGVIRDSQGNAVAGVKVSNNIVWDGGHVQQTRITDANGRYLVRMLASANHAFLLQPPNSLLNQYGKSVVSNVSLLSDNFNNDMTLGRLVELQGTLRDQFGAALADKVLRFSTFGKQIDQIRTGANGEYFVKMVAANYSINVSTGQFETNLPDVSLTANMTKNLQLTLHDFTGRVIDVNGVAVAGVTIRVQDSLYYGGGSTQVQLQTNLSGEFSVRLPPSNVNCIVQPKTLSGLLSIFAPSISLNGNIERHFVLHRADLRAPVIISKPTVTGLTQGAAVIGWETDELASTQVVVNGQTFSVPGFRTLHSVAVSGLAAQTPYTATVSSSDPSGNGPTSDTVAFTTLAAPDTTAPLVLNGPIVSAITHNSATVDWTTDEAATTKLVYGIGTPTQPVTVSGLRSVHQVNLADLAADTDYVLRVEAVDAAGNGPVQSAIVTFRTAQAPDTRVPVIVAGPVITNVTDTSVTVAWQTDEPANSGVSLQKGDEREAVNDSALVTQHEVTLTGLTAESVYKLVVSSTDGAGNGPVLSPEITFTTLATPDTQGPVFVESLRVVGITHQSAVVQWRTDEVANSTVEFGTSSTTLNRVASDSKLKTQHIVHLTDLAINTEYFIRARSVDAQGNESVSTIASFRTRNHPDAAAPVFTAVPTVIGNTDKTATLAWETSEPADYVVTWGANAIDENVLSDGKRKQKQRVTLTNLEPGVSYSFAVTVSDGSGNSTRYESIASVGSVTHSNDGFAIAMSALGVSSANASGGGAGGFLASLLADTTAPAFATEPVASWLSNDRVLLGWVTNEPVSVQVSYGLASSTERRLAGVLVPSLLHSVVLTGLESGGNYAFDVTIRDIAGNITTSSGTFVARSLADLLAPVVSTLTVSDRAAGSVFVNLVTDEPVMHEVRFGLSSTAMHESVHSLAYDKLQVLTLTGLVDGSTYYYQVISEDAAGNRVVSAVRSFIAGAAGIDPGTLAALIMKLAGQVADRILVGAQNLVVSLNEAVLPKPVDDYVVRWYFDGVHIPALDGMIDAEIPSHLLTSGSHTMRAELTDTTVSHLSTLRLSQRVTVQPPPVVITPDLSAFENARVVITRNGVEISSAPQGATDITIRIDGYTPAPGANHTLRWYLDGVHHPEFDNVTSGIAAFNPLTPGKHTIRLEMTDNAAPTLVTARTSKVVAVSPGSGGGALDAGLLLLLLAGGLRLRQRKNAA